MIQVIENLFEKEEKGQFIENVISEIFTNISPIINMISTKDYFKLLSEFIINNYMLIVITSLYLYKF